MPKKTCSKVVLLVRVLVIQLFYNKAEYYITKRLGGLKVDLLTSNRWKRLLILEGSEVKSLQNQLHTFLTSEHIYSKMDEKV